MMEKGIMQFHVHVWVENLCGLKDFHGGKFFDSHAWVSAFKDFHNFKDFCWVKIYDFTYKIFFEKFVVF